MLHLLKIDLKKMTNYRTFWVITGLYFAVLGLGAASGMEFLKWLKRTFEDFGGDLNINRIPLYHFPDIWLNLIWCAGLLKIVLGVMVITSVTNEYAYRTMRQNIIDGLSRTEFLLSKVYTNILLSVASMVVIGIVAFVTGLIYSPDISWNWIVADIEFLPLYFLEVFMYLSFALMLGLLVQRAGLSIIILLLSKAIEAIITANLVEDYVPALLDYFPMRAIWNLIEWPFPRYAFQEIKDYVDFKSVAIVVAWIGLFNYFSYLKLKRSDI
ncbi:MAG TPA: ABC transporter permease subunit [Chryseosolibacter sp.]|nr:ABC transporter permease subunit [Chryseosolibacter sp.]